MPDTRFSLIGKIVVLTVKAPDSILRAILKEMQQALKIKKGSRARVRTRKSTTRKPKARRKKATPAQLRARKQFAMRVKRGDFR